jgi:hypothetical protein
VFAAFEETGHIFEPYTTEKCRKFILLGNTDALPKIFPSFRG